MREIETPRTPLGVRLKFSALAMIPVLIAIACCALSLRSAGRGAAFGWLPVAVLMAWLLWWRRSPTRHVHPWWIRCLVALPDQPPLAPNPQHPPGSSVRIDTGHEEVLLAHLPLAGER